MSTNLDDSFAKPSPAPRAPITRADILAHLRFGAKIEVETKKGLRYVCTARPGKEFFALWKTDSESLRAEGYTLKEWPEGSGTWKVSKWERVPEAVIIARQQASELSRATDVPSNIVIPCPAGRAFFGYQKAGVVYALGRDGTLIADEPGLGKTAQAIGLVNCLPETKRILVICPASLKENWRREIKMWQVQTRPIYVADGKMLPDLLGWVIVNYDVLTRHEEILMRLEFDVLICDEAHYLKNPKAQRTSMVFGVKPTNKQRLAGVRDIPPLKAKKRLLLTGTPICNRPIELFPLINFLNPHEFGDFFKFAIRYCDGNKDSGHWNFKGASNLSELQILLRKTVMVRRLKRDVLADLPPKTRRIVEFSPTGELKKAIDAERAMFADEDAYKAHLNEIVTKLARPGASIGERAVLRKKMAIAKTEMKDVMTYLDTAEEESEKVILFCWHREVWSRLMAYFGNRAVGMNGDTPMKDRQAAVDAFQQNPRIHWIIGNITTMGTGLTLTASNRVIMFEIDDVPGNNTQCEDRAHRIGQRDNVLVDHLIVAGTIEVVSARNCIEKQEIIEQAIDKRADHESASVPTVITATEAPQRTVSAFVSAPNDQLQLL